MRFLKYILLIPFLSVFIGSILIVLSIQNDRLFIYRVKALDNSGCTKNVGDIPVFTVVKGTDGRSKTYCLDITKLTVNNNGTMEPIMDPKIYVRDSGNYDGPYGPDDSVQTRRNSQPVMPVNVGNQNQSLPVYLYMVKENNGQDDPYGCLFGDTFTKSVKSGEGGNLEDDTKHGRCCPVGYVSTQYSYFPDTPKVCCPVSDFNDQSDYGEDTSFDIKGIDHDFDVGSPSDDKGAQVKFGVRNSRGVEYFGIYDNLASNGYWSKEAKSLRKYVDDNDDSARCNPRGGQTDGYVVGDYEMINLTYFLYDPIIPATPTPRYQRSRESCATLLYNYNVLQEDFQEILADQQNIDRGITSVTFNDLFPPAGQESQVNVPAKVTQRWFKMCDACYRFDKPPAESSIEDVEKLNSCIQCEREDNTVWNGFGCVEATGTGVVNWINMASIGIAGFVIILRGGQIIIIFIGGDSGDKMEEAKSLVISTVTFVIIIAGGYIIIRVVAYRVVKIPVPIFGDVQPTVTPTP